MKRVLIVGASSFIGAQLCVYLRKYYRIYGTYNRHRPRIDGVPCFRFPITAQAPIQELLAKLRPDTVVYCAGERNEARCEADPMGALMVNAEAPAIFAETLSSWNGRLIYLSSVKVFSGERGGYRESDPPSPLSVYGKTKLDAESLLERHKNVFILRLGTLYGIAAQGSDSILNRFLQAGWAGTETGLIRNELRSFFSCEELNKVVGTIIDAHGDYAGTYHVASNEYLSYFAFGRLVASVFGISADVFQPVEGETFRHDGFDQSRRGTNTTLDGSKLVDTFYLRLPSTESALVNLRLKLVQGKQ